MTTNDELTLWYIHVEDADRNAGDRRQVTATEHLRTIERWHTMWRMLPTCSVTNHLPAGAIAVTLQDYSSAEIDQVDAALLAAGFKRDPHAPPPTPPADTKPMNPQGH